MSEKFELTNLFIVVIVCCCNNKMVDQRTLDIEETFCYEKTDDIILIAFSNDFKCKNRCLFTTLNAWMKKLPENSSYAEPKAK